jgi:hypothetical protein
MHGILVKGAGLTDASSRPACRPAPTQPVRLKAVQSHRLGINTPLMVRL